MDNNRANNHNQSINSIKMNTCHPHSLSSGCLDNVAKSVLEDKDVIGTNAKNQINHKDVQKFKVEYSKHSWRDKAN